MTKAFEFRASFPTHAQPYKPHGEDGGAVVFQVVGPDWDTIPLLHKDGKGKALRILVEITDAAAYGKKAVEEE